MLHAYRYLFPALWLAWVAYWCASARGVKVALRRESRSSRLLHVIPLLLVAALLVWPARAPLPLLGEPFLPLSSRWFWTGAGLTAGGLLFAVWARRHLGRNWSGTVTIKQGHELITSGPYAIVRHPIYSGLLLAIVGTALARGGWSGILAVALAFFAFWRKSRVEERWMQEEFGEAYQTYRHRVAALIPFLP